jgi:hypothetical protein
MRILASLLLRNFLRQAKGGKMIDVKKKWLGGIVAVLVLIVSSPAFGQVEGSENTASRFSLGAGIGIPFGVFGLGCEVNPVIGSRPDSLLNYFSLNVGLGTTFIGVGYSLGFRLYPLGRDRAWAPKASLMYGTVSIVNWEYAYRGFSVGGGVVHRLSKKTSVDADVIFIINSFGYDLSSSGRIKLSLGLRRHFD